MVIINTIWFHLKAMQFAYSKTAPQHEIEHRKWKLLHKWRMYLQSTILISKQKCYWEHPESPPTAHGAAQSSTSKLDESLSVYYTSAGARILVIQA